jgi:DNA-binding IclR family transcriptional regulator
MKSYTVHTLDKGLAVLEALAAAGEDLTLTEVAHRLKESRTAVFRLLRTLQERGYVQQDAGSKRYRLGLGAWEVGSRALRRTGLVEAAQPVLKWLAQVTGETSLLSVLRDNDVLYLDVVHGSSPLRVCLEPGSWAPAYATASGKTILAHHPARLPQALSGELRQLTPKTITQPSRLRRLLAEVRRAGVATNREEHREGIASLAAPIFDARGECVAAVGLAGPAMRFTDENLEELTRHVRKAAHEISAKLGWREP